MAQPHAVADRDDSTDAPRQSTAATAVVHPATTVLLCVLLVGTVGAIVAGRFGATDSLAAAARLHASVSTAAPGGTFLSSAHRDEDDCAIVAVYYSEALDWITEALVLGDGNSSATCAFGWHIHIHDRSPSASSRAWLNSSLLSQACRARIVITEEPNWGAEATGYLRFISGHYGALPRFTFFSHGDPRAHSPNFDAALRCLNPAWTTGFTPLNDYYLVLVPPTMPDQQGLGNPYRGTADIFVHALAAALAQEEGASAPAGGHSVAWPPTMSGSKLAFHCCATFVATRAAIQKHPHRLYEIVLQFLMNSTYFVPGVGGGKDHAHFIEPLWQIIFGEALAMAPDAPCQRAVQPWRDACAAKSCAPRPKPRAELLSLTRDRLRAGLRGLGGPLRNVVAPPPHHGAAGAARPGVHGYVPLD